MIIGHEDGFAAGSGRYGSRSNSAFRCEKCGHAKANHSGEGCDRGDCDCNGFSDTRENADKPYWEQEKGQTFKCDQCKDEFWTRQALAAHKANLHGGRKNADRPPTESELREYHAKHGHKGKFLQCEECAKVFDADYTMDNADPIARHENARAAGQERYGSRKNASLECPKSGCGKSFDDKGQLQRHLMGAHGVEREIARARAEGVADPGRENADGGCAHCGHSFYQHSTGYDNQWHCKPGCKCDGFYIANAGPMRCSCGGKITKVGDDDFECDDCGQRYETDDWRSDRLKAKT